MVQEIKLNQIDAVVTTVGTPWTDGNLPTEKAVRDAISGLAPSFDSIMVSRLTGDATATVTYAHTLWVVPTFFKLDWILYSNSLDSTGWITWTFVWGVYKCVYSYNTSASSTWLLATTTSGIWLFQNINSLDTNTITITISNITTTDFDLTYTLSGTWAAPSEAYSFILTLS